MRNALTNNSPHHGRDLSQNNAHAGDLRSFINQVWNLFDTQNNPDLSELEPKIEVTENKNSVTVAAELPGIDEKDIDVQISSDGYLSISGEKRQETQNADKNNYFSEISYGMFRRTIPLPWDLNFDEAGADYADGVLTVSIPKTPDEQQKFKKIDVRRGKKQTAKNKQEENAEE